MKIRGQKIRLMFATFFLNPFFNIFDEQISKTLDSTFL